MISGSVSPYGQYKSDKQVDIGSGGSVVEIGDGRCVDLKGSDILQLINFLFYKVGFTFPKNIMVSVYIGCPLPICFCTYINAKLHNFTLYRSSLMSKQNKEKRLFIKISSEKPITESVRVTPFLNFTNQYTEKE